MTNLIPHSEDFDLHVEKALLRYAKWLEGTPATPEELGEGMGALATAARRYLDLVGEIGHMRRVTAHAQEDREKVVAFIARIKDLVDSFHQDVPPAPSPRPSPEPYPEVLGEVFDEDSNG